MNGTPSKFSVSTPHRVGHHNRMSDSTRALISSALRGALDLERTPTGVIPHRLPRHVHHQHDALFLRFNSAQTSGVRLALSTAATRITLIALSTRFFFPGMDPQAVPVPYAAVANGQEMKPTTETFGSYDVLSFDGVTHHQGAPAALTFDLGGEGIERSVEIWLPNNAAVEILDLTADAPMSAEPAPAAPRWTHYGSSISHCAEAESPLGTWPAAAARKLGLNLTSLAFGGSAHLDNFAARIIRDLDADLISLKIGINIINGDTMKRRTFIPAVHGFIDTIREAKPDVPVLVVSPIVCPMHETAPGPTTYDFATGTFRPVPPPVTNEDLGLLHLAEIRSILADIVSARSQTDPVLYYLDGLDLFGPDDAGDLPDGLHPNTKGYGRMAQRFVGNEHTLKWLRRAATPDFR